MLVSSHMADRADQTPEFWTIGHSTRTLGEFFAVLAACLVEALVDVRTVPLSRRHPWFNADSLALTLPPQGIAYVPMPALGGFRKPRPDSPNTAWTNASFRGYADYMLTDDFERALDDLVELGRHRRVAIMCAEAVPWRCHRSLIGDALVARGYVVRDIMSAEKAEAHRMTPFARVGAGRVTYPAGP